MVMSANHLTLERAVDGSSQTMDHVLPRAAPESQGVPSSAVLRFVEALERQGNEMHSFMLLRHGSVVAEGWWAPYQSEHPHRLNSLSKSFAATAVGLAVAEGLFSLDDPVPAFFPEAAAGANADFSRLHVRHLLAMATGHAVDTIGAMFRQPDGDWIRGIFEEPLLHEPGTRFLYNQGATYLLCAIVQKTSGVTLNEYLGPRLYAPLGIQSAVWTTSPQGITTGWIGLSLTTEAIAKFGQLYLQNGVWQGRRLLPEAWVTEATTAHVASDVGAGIDWSQGYGFQFWRSRHGGYRGDGAFGQYCLVMPEQAAVLAMTAGVVDMQPPLDLVWEILLPAMAAGPLPDDRPAQQALAEKCASLALPPVPGQAESPLAARVSGRTYRADENELGIATLALSFSPAGGTLEFQTAAGAETLPVGYGSWQRGQTSLFNDRELHGQTPVFASGAWTADDRFTLVIRLVVAPVSYTWVLQFAGDELLVEGHAKSLLEVPRTLRLSARAQP
jgi:CubicO group peptidase (beta-lactamase class C family)